MQNGCLITFKKYIGNHRKCSIKKLFLNILQYSQENTCVEVSFSPEYSKIFKTTYFEEQLQIAASENLIMKLRKIKNCS